jgi:hypothetical protein
MIIIEVVGFAEAAVFIFTVVYFKSFFKFKVQSLKAPGPGSKFKVQSSKAPSPGLRLEFKRGANQFKLPSSIKLLH